MGLMDRMKAQASHMAERAQEAGKVGQAKIEALQARRKADALLTELGRIAYEAQSGRGAPGDDARKADIIEQLHQYEAEYGPLGNDVSGAEGGGSDATTGDSPSGDASAGAPSGGMAGGIPRSKNVGSSDDAGGDATS